MSRRSLLGTLLLVATTVVAPRATDSAAAPERRLHRVRVIESSTLGTAHPSGVGSLPGSGLYFVAGPSGAGARTDRLHLLDGLGDPAGEALVPSGIPDAQDVAFDAAGSRLLVLDDAAVTLLAVGFDRAGRPLDESPRRLVLPHLGPFRCEGMTVDPRSGEVFLLDRLRGRVARFVPGDETHPPSAVSWIDLGELGARHPSGIAFDPESLRLYVMAPREQRLWELGLDGKALASWDVSAYHLLQSRALAFAPSGDQTDDPARLGLYVADAGDGDSAGRVVELRFLQAGRPAVVSPEAITATLVRTVETWRWSPPSPDPSGITYDPNTGHLIIVDGEVEEVRIWAHANLFESTLSGALVHTADLTPFTIEPVGAAYNPNNRHVFVSDDDARKVFDVAPGSDGKVGTSDDVIRWFSTKTFSSGDPEGCAYDPRNNRLYIADGVNAEIYEIQPGPNGTFDGISSSTDDVVSHWDTGRYDVEDPETVEYIPDRGTLFLIGTAGDKVVEVTTDGSQLSEFDVSFVPVDKPAGMAYAPSSSIPNSMSLYLVDRQDDNDSNSSENDGLCFEIAIGPPGSGGGPGPDPPPGTIDRRIASGSDDAEESASGSVSVTGNDLELVHDSNDQTVGLRFPSLAIPPGTRVARAWVQLEADEKQNEATSLKIQAQAIDNAPAFTSSSRSISNRIRTSSFVTWNPPAWNTVGEAVVPQQTPDLSAVINEVLSRPGWAGGNAIALVITGTGHRTARSREGRSAGAPLLHLELGPPGNRAPIVDAGPDQTVALPEQATLAGTVTDDGLPLPPSLSSSWSATGPGPVVFSNRSSPTSRATFTVIGTYVLKLTGGDGELSATDSVRITVQNAPPPGATVERRIVAGSDDAEEGATGSVNLTSSDLELVHDSSDQKIGLRFTALAIPPGARIDSAWVQFNVDETQNETTTLAVQAQAADNTVTFSSTNKVSTRPRTSASVSWTPSPWTTTGQPQRTIDLSPVIQEVVGRSGWASGNSLVIIITGTGHRTADAFEAGAAGAPLLHVRYH